MLDSRPFDAALALAPLRRRIGLARTGRDTLRGAALGFVLGLTCLMVSRLSGLAQAHTLSWIVVLTGALVGCAAGLLRWPAAYEVARLADRRLGLQDRLTTAVELGRRETPFSRLVGVDLGRRLGGLPLSEVARGQLRGRDAVVPAALCLLFAVVSALGSVAPRGAGNLQDSRRIHAAAAVSLPRIMRAARSESRPRHTSTSAAALSATLGRLQRELLHASSRQEALRDVSSTQQKLQAMGGSLHAANPRSLSHLGRSLRPAMTPAQRAAARRGPAASGATSDRVLRKLARTISSVPSHQRAALSRVLRQAATSMRNTAIAPSLAAASAHAQRRPGSAAVDLQRAAAALSQELVAQDERTRINSVTAQLDTLKNQIAGVGSAPRGNGSAGSKGRRSRGSSSARSGSGRGGGSGSAHAGSKGTARGSRGAASRGGVPGAARGSAPGQGGSVAPGAGFGQGGIGGFGRGGGRGLNSSRGGSHTVTVYIPGIGKAGRHTVISDPGRGGSAHGALVPYHAVVARYRAEARDATNRAEIPLGLRAYVRAYFSAIAK